MRAHTNALKKTAQLGNTHRDQRHPPAAQTKPKTTCQTGSFDLRNGWVGAVEEGGEGGEREEGEEDGL